MNEHENFAEVKVNLINPQSSLLKNILMNTGSGKILWRNNKAILVLTPKYTVIKICRNSFSFPPLRPRTDYFRTSFSTIVPGIYHPKNERSYYSPASK